MRVIRNGLIIILIFLIPQLGISQNANYSKVDGCNMINDLFTDIVNNKVDLDTYKKHFDEHNEIEIFLEFEWCRSNNIDEDDCQTTLIEHLEDSSFSFTIERVKKKT